MANQIDPKRAGRAREAFLAVLRETCNVSQGARQAGVSRRTVYQWRLKYPEFAADWDDAEQEAADRLEAEAWRRGVEGIEKPIVSGGEIVATYKEYSDRMLEILLKGHRPEKYTDRSKVEHSGKISLEDLITGVGK